jgi:hypothetical protein
MSTSPVSFLSQPLQHLRDPRPADAQIASERCTVLEVARVEQRPVVLSQLEWIAFLTRNRGDLGFGVVGTVPREKGDYGGSM